jgi:hypothetical protein
MAQAYPQTTVHALDFHAASIDRARELAHTERRAANVSSRSPRRRTFQAAGMTWSASLIVYTTWATR